MLIILFTYFFIRFQPLDNPIRFPLSPHKIIVTPFLKITHRPPKPSFQSRAHHLRIISLTDVVLVRGESRIREHNLIIVRSINLHQECPVMPLPQIQVLLFVFGIR